MNLGKVNIFEATSSCGFRRSPLAAKSAHERAYDKRGEETLALCGAVFATSRACKHWRYQLPNRGDRITPACHITHPPMANTTHYYQLVEHVSTFQ